jgi:hypothetical protein
VLAGTSLLAPQRGLRVRKVGQKGDVGRGYNLAMRAVLTCCVAVLVALGGNTAEAASPFCATPSKNPFLAPLAHLPRLHEPPKNGVVPFAKLVSIVPVSGALVENGQDVGFAFPVQRAGQKSWSKPWLKVNVRLTVLNGNGRIVRVLRHSTRSIQWLGANRVSYRTLDQSRLYRVDVEFEKLDGRILARYAQYFRSAAPKFEARIALSQASIAPGEAIVARLENLGVTNFGAGFGYRAERFNGTSWEADQSLQGNKSVPRVLVILGPAATFDCATIPIPANQAPGVYRVGKTLSETSSGRRVEVAGEFTIAGDS